MLPALAFARVLRCALQCNDRGEDVGDGTYHDMQPDGSIIIKRREDA
jgi:hypothetical protein